MLEMAFFNRLWSQIDLDQILIFIQEICNLGQITLPSSYSLKRGFSFY